MEKLWSEDQKGFLGIQKQGRHDGEVMEEGPRGFSEDTEIGPHDEEVVKTLTDGLGMSKQEPAMEGLWRLDLMNR